MVSGMTAITRFLGIMLSFVHTDIKISINQISADCVISAKCVINSYFDELVDDSHDYTSYFVRELLLPQVFRTM